MPRSFSSTMPLQNLWHFLESQIFCLSAASDPKQPVFNPYNDWHPELDQPEAPDIRRTNLHNYLSSFPQRPEILMVGEAPGWRGCRFSGIPFTSEAQLCATQKPFPNRIHGRQSSLRKMPYSEATATVFWKTMAAYYPQFLVWNCIPLHLHQPGRPLSNRTPRRNEIALYLPLLAELVRLVAPRQIIAVGANASRAIQQIGARTVAARHPSHGGATQFHLQMTQAMSEALELTSGIQPREEQTA